jgi:NAD(P)-dependent dehydrogenase (short-subunit alcohol dehydrogenase family)
MSTDAAPDPAPPRPLADRIALVAGATRGSGRGIALALGDAGATVYCTGRSSAASKRPTAGGDASPFELASRPETIEETAEQVTSRGGRGIAVQVDHTDAAQVAALTRRIETEHGRLDLLVNCIWGGDSLTQWNTPVWELELDQGRTMFDRGIWTHLVTTRHAVPLLLNSDRGLLIEVTDGDSLAYRGTLFYDLVKTTIIRMAFGLAEELRSRRVTVAAITPGFLRSEAMLEHFEVDESRWRDAGERDPHFLHSETPLYIGRGIAALAADPSVFRHTGRVLSSWQLATAYGFTDADGERPDWGRHAAASGFGKDQVASHARFLAGFKR